MAIINKSARKTLLNKVGSILEATVQTQDKWAKKSRQEGHISYPSMVERVLDRNYRIYDEAEILASDIQYTIATTSWLKDVIIRNGCTRVVMMFKTGKFKNLVIKIPYGTTYDYCKGEVQNYRQAPDELKPFLARSEYIGKVTIHSYSTSKTITLPVYVMEKVDEVEKLGKHIYEKMEDPCDVTLPEKDHEKVADAYFRCRSEWVMNLLYEYMGMEKYLKFLDYIRENYINDLHSGNIGSLRGNPVLFDYAGYREDDGECCDYDYEDDYDC